MKEIAPRLMQHVLAAARSGRMPGHVFLCGQGAADRHTPVALAAKALSLPGFRFMGGDLRESIQLKGLLRIPEYGAIVVVEDIDLVRGEVCGLLYSIMAGGKLPSFSDPALTLYLPALMVIGFSAKPESVDKKLLETFSLKLGFTLE